MKLTKSTDYALRILLDLAKSNEVKTMPLLSESLHIPYDNLAKLIQSLAKAQLVFTKPGKNGGVLIRRSPQDISLKTVIDIIEGPILLSDCDFCGLTCNCQIKSVFSDLQSRIEGLFEGVKLTQLMGK